MKPWAKQQDLKDTGHIPTQDEILNIAQTFKEPQEKALFLLAYLSAGRISEVVGILSTDLEATTKNGREIVLIHIPNRKNRTRNFKDIPIPKDRPKEAEMIKIVMDYTTTRTGFVFPFRTTARAWQILNKIGYNPHWLRHIRLTHLETIYGISPERLRVFAGWSDGRPAKHYIELNYGDVLDGM
jgi:hypothetical protein